MSSANDVKTEIEEGLVSDNPKTFWKEYKKNVKKSIQDYILIGKKEIRRAIKTWCGCIDISVWSIVWFGALFPVAGVIILIKDVPITLWKIRKAKRNLNLAVC